MPAKTFNISMDKELVARIDRVAQSEYSSRSDLLRKLTVEYLEKKEKEQPHIFIEPPKEEKRDKDYDRNVIDTAREILQEYYQDFQNLSER